MDSSDFSTLIGRLEREADAHPQLYLGKVAVAAALGFLVPGLVVLEILACCFAIVHALVTGAHAFDPCGDRRPRRRRGADRNDSRACASRSRSRTVCRYAEDAPDLFRLIDVIARKVVAAAFADA